MKQLDPKAFWLFFIRGLLAWFVAVLLIVGQLFPLIFMAAEEGRDAVMLAGGSIALYVVLALVLSYIYATLTYKFYRYELTDLVLKKEHGIIWKKYVSIPYDRIQNVDIHRGVWARIFGLSDLQIQTAGGITKSSYGAFSEGRLPGVSKEVAEQLRDELIQRARSARNSNTSQGL